MQRQNILKARSVHEEHQRKFNEEREKVSNANTTLENLQREDKLEFERLKAAFRSAENMAIEAEKKVVQATEATKKVEATLQQSMEKISSTNNEVRQVKSTLSQTKATLADITEKKQGCEDRLKVADNEITSLEKRLESQEQKVRVERENTQKMKTEKMASLDMLYKCRQEKAEVRRKTTEEIRATQDKLEELNAAKNKLYTQLEDAISDKELLKNDCQSFINQMEEQDKIVETHKKVVDALGLSRGDEKDIKVYPVVSLQALSAKEVAKSQSHISTNMIKEYEQPLTNEEIQQIPDNFNGVNLREQVIDLRDNDIDDAITNVMKACCTRVENRLVDFGLQRPTVESTGDSGFPTHPSSTITWSGDMVADMCGYESHELMLDDFKDMLAEGALMSEELFLSKAIQVEHLISIQFLLAAIRHYNIKDFVVAMRLIQDHRNIALHYGPVNLAKGSAEYAHYAMYRNKNGQCFLRQVSTV